jgi:hypothetical protein
MPYEMFAAQLRAASMRGRMLLQRRDDLICMLVRMPDFCAEARRSLLPEHFAVEGERPHQTIVEHLYALLDAGTYEPGTVPMAALYDSITAHLFGKPDAELAEPWVGELLNRPDMPDGTDLSPGLLWRVYHADLGAFSREFAWETLRQFLEERAVVDHAYRLISGFGGRIPDNYPKLFRDIADNATRIEAIGTDPFRLPMPEGWTPRPLERFPTGCAWIDKLLEGQVAGDVNGLIGVFSGGKTTAVTQLVVMTGSYFLKVAERAGVTPKIAVLASYEEREETMRPRIMSCAARVSKNKLEEIKSFDELTRRGKLDDYEIRLYAGQDQHDLANLDGEYERLMAAMADLNRCVRFIDMREKGRGRGWISELASYLARLRDEQHVEIGLVCIDYVNAMCRRHLSAEGKDFDRNLRHYISMTPGEAEEKIAKPFHCPVWLAQQFSGEANKKTPTARLTIADSGEATTFGENLVFCIGFGAIHPQHRVQMIHCLKARRRGGTGRTGIIRIDGDLGRILDVDHLFSVQGGEIVDRRIAERFEGATADEVVGAGKVAIWKPV